MNQSNHVVRGEQTRYPLTRHFPNRLESSWFSLFAKRLADLFLSSLALVLVLSWLVPLIALLIRLDSPGPVFFRQKRSGRGRKPFVCYKFRTMYHTSMAMPFVQARGNDPRVTPLGDFLRRSSLDEFPQFFNVLLGSMSLVGPRPHVPDLDARFGATVSNYFERNTVKPGITGLAQVKGCRGETSTEDHMSDRIALDVQYTRHWSPWLDSKIIYWTALDVLVHLKAGLMPRPTPSSPPVEAPAGLQWNTQPDRTDG